MLENGYNDDWKQLLMGILNMLFLGLILCIYNFNFLKY